VGVQLHAFLTLAQEEKLAVRFKTKEVATEFKWVIDKTQVSKLISNNSIGSNVRRVLQEAA
jgi:hypothetical protein